ncbi:hypothetical protein KY335_04620 [Candidatus Woesearchaeota archaeon]|nr:hypothetical protein [Candidatus Woesearchaeota archaeon]
MRLNRLIIGALFGLASLAMLAGCGSKDNDVEPHRGSGQHIGRYSVIPQQTEYPKAEEPKKEPEEKRYWPGPIELTPEEQLELELDHSRYTMRLYGK